MSDTPRTEAERDKQQAMSGKPAVSVEFARQLERELYESYARESQLREALEQHGHTIQCGVHYNHPCNCFVLKALTLPPPPVVSKAEHDKVVAELENARVAFDEHPDSEFDLTARIVKLRDEHRNDFHVHTQNLDLKERLAAHEARIKSTPTPP